MSWRGKGESTAEGDSFQVFDTYANPWIPVITGNGMRCSYVKNSA